MLVYLKGEYTILGGISFSRDEKRFQFSVPFENKPEVVIHVIPSSERNKGAIEAFHQCEITEEMWKVFQSGDIDGRDLPEELQEELSEIKSPLSEATRKVLDLIKNSLNQYGLDDNLFSTKGTYWSTNQTDWKHIPMRLYGRIIPSTYLFLDKNYAKNIQEYLNNNLEPFFASAMQFLHKAKKENHPHYKWINATIAAELAIKEFLSHEKLELNLEPLLMEIPSPPISKLYGKILNSYIDEQSPKRKSIIKGEEKRNLLIHRPKEIKINSKEADQYVRDVEFAIYHLLNFLYPDDMLISMIYKRKLGITQCPQCNKINDRKERKCFNCKSELENN